MKIYILRKEAEIVEVTEGREERRDYLIRRGYEWVETAQKGSVEQPAESPALPASPVKGKKEAERESLPDWLTKDEGD